MKTLLRILEISEETNNVIRYNTGEAFATAWLGGDYHATTMLLGCAAYWDWWNGIYRQRAINFLELHATTRTTPLTLLRLFEAELAPDNIIAYPGQYVIDQALNKVWSEAWAEDYLITAKARQLCAK
jgi:hypothetical protein